VLAERPLRAISGHNRLLTNARERGRLQRAPTCVFTSIPMALADRGLDRRVGSSVRYRFDFAGSPGLVEPGFERAVEPQDHKPAFARNGLNPVVLHALRCLGAEPDVDRSVGIDLHVLVLTRHARELLVRLQHGTTVPSIAVLPFDDLSADQNLGYLGDGVAEDIITALSRFPDLVVVARGSSFAYKGKAIDRRQIGREF
jgi:hypothetical protein